MPPLAIPLPHTSYSPIIADHLNERSNYQHDVRASEETRQNTRSRVVLVYLVNWFQHH